MNQELLTTNDLAERLGTPVYKLRYLSATKRVPKGRKYGQTCLYTPDEVEKIVAWHSEWRRLDQGVEPK